MNEEVSSSHTGHHRHGPSSLEMYENCPCYKPDNTRDTTAADEGTLCHEAAEKEDLDILDTDEQVESVKKAIALKHSAIEELGPNAIVNVEEQVSVLDLTRGTFDLMVMNAEKTLAWLIDYKFGRNKVTEAEFNGQVQAYVAGAFEKYPTLREIRATLIFPRLDWATTAMYTPDMLPAIHLRIATIIERANAVDKQPTPTEKSCRFCGDKASCKAMHRYALHMGETLPVPVQYDPGQLVDPREMSKVLVLASIMEDWAKQARRTITKLVVEDGVEVPGFGIRSRKGAHGITEVYDATQLIMSKYGVLPPQLAQAMSMSLPKLVDLVSAITGEKKKAVREEVLEVLESCTIQKDTITYLQRDKGKTNEEIIQG